MNEPTQTPAPEHVVPVPVPVSAPAPSSAPPVPPVASAVAASDDLPTSRLQSILAPLPPPVPPPGHALKTQPLRAISRDDATAKLARAQRRGWQSILAQVKRAAAVVPRRLGAREAWTERRVGLACAALGLVMIAVALVLGWESVASERLEKLEHVQVAVAVVFSRAAIAIAAMVVGYGLLRVGERTALASRVSGARRDDPSKVD